jgi:hypothetical protein
MLGGLEWGEVRGEKSEVRGQIAEVKPKVFTSAI